MLTNLLPLFTGMLILQVYTRGAIKIRTMLLAILKLSLRILQTFSTYFGLIKCTVLPPRGLFHPVLPYRTKDKLMFPLCKTCSDTLNQNPCTHTDEERAILGTWCHVELMKAIEKGYEVLEIHEVWHWEETTDELFKDYVNMYLKLKQEASGYPKHCVTDEQKQRYIDEYYEHEGIRLDPNKIEYNPGLRTLAKLALNSLWGTYIMLDHTVNPR